MKVKGVALSLVLLGLALTYTAVTNAEPGEGEYKQPADSTSQGGYDSSPGAAGLPGGADYYDPYKQPDNQSSSGDNKGYSDQGGNLRSAPSPWMQQNNKPADTGSPAEMGNLPEPRTSDDEG